MNTYTSGKKWVALDAYLATREGQKVPIPKVVFDTSDVIGRRGQKAHCRSADGILKQSRGKSTTASE